MKGNKTDLEYNQRLKEIITGSIKIFILMVMIIIVLNIHFQMREAIKTQRLYTKKLIQYYESDMTSQDFMSVP